VWRGGQQPVALTTSVGGTVSIALDSRRGQLFVTGRNQVAEVWDLGSRQVVKRLPIASNILDGTMNDGVPIVIQPVGSGRGGTTYIAQFKGQRAAEFRPEDFATLATLRRPTIALRFNTTGEWCVVATRDSVDVLQLSGAKVVRSFDAASPRSVAVSPNGAYVAFETAAAIAVLPVSGREATVQAAPSYRGGAEPTLPSTRRTPSSQAPALNRAAPSAQTIAAASDDPPIAVSPDGQVIVLTNADGSALPVPVVGGSVARTYPVAAADPRWLRGHRGQIVDVDFSLDGSLISTSGADGTSRLWRNPIARPAPVRPSSSSSWTELWKTLRDRTTACLSADERMRLLNQPEPEARSAAGKCDADYGGKVFGAATGPTS
jgi:WD40 repeat protein